MTTIAKLSNGTLLKVGDGASPEVFTTIPEVMKLQGPSVRFDLLDVSSHDTPNLFKEWIPGFADGENIGFEMNWRPSNTVHIVIRTSSYAATLKNYKVVYPDTPSNTVAAAGYVERFSPNADVGKQMTATGQVKITGAPTWS